MGYVEGFATYTSEVSAILEQISRAKLRLEVGVKIVWKENQCVNSLDKSDILPCRCVLVESRKSTWRNKAKTPRWGSEVLT